MTEQELEKRKERVANEGLVISRTEEGFRVYSIHNPSKIYLVKQEGERWVCTCPDFEYHKADTTWRCKHILAIAPWVRRNGNEAPPVGDQPAAEQTVATERTKQPPRKQKAQQDQPTPPVPVQMIMKRSVSPDGRIDSISVEFSLPVSGCSNGDIKERALSTLELQKEIVGAFLKLNAQKSVVGTSQLIQPSKPEKAVGKPVFARMIDIGKVNGKWGERFCINLQINGRRCRLFGSPEQLAEHIRAAGYEIDPENIREGLRLNLACRAVTKPSDDGRYLNVERVLPLGKKVPQGGPNESDIPY